MSKALEWSVMNEDVKEDKSAVPVINARSVSKAFSTRQVLTNVDFQLEPSESVCLCGVNGVGKSTLLRIIAGLLQPDKGSVELFGYDINRDPEEAKPKLGVISHQSMTYPALTVWENLCFFARLYGVQDARSRIVQLLQDLGLMPYRHDRADVLSRGLLQRLSIARALVHGPAVLLADEPFTGLDQEACAHLIAVLTGFADHAGSLIMTTHDTSVGLRCCRRVVVMDAGRIVFDGATSEVDQDDFANNYVSYARKSRRT